MSYIYEIRLYFINGFSFFTTTHNLNKKKIKKMYFFVVKYSHENDKL